MTKTEGMFIAAVVGLILGVPPRARADGAPSAQPGWTSRGSFKDGGSIYAVGISEGTRNKSKAHAVAVSRAQDEIEKAIETRVCLPGPDYLTSADSAPAREKCETESYEEMQRRNAVNAASRRAAEVESWQEPRGALFVLVRLDSATAVREDIVKDQDKGSTAHYARYPRSKSCLSFLPESDDDKQWLAYLDRFGTLVGWSCLEPFSPLGMVLDESNDAQRRRRVDALLARGADVNGTAVLYENLSPLHLAVRNSSDVDLLKDLLAHGAKADTRNVDDMTPLMDAALKGKTEFVRLLLEAGAGINDRDDDHETALMLAAEAGRTAVVRLLLPKEPDLFVKNAGGLTALAIAEKAGEEDTARILRKAMGQNETPAAPDLVQAAPRSEVDKPVYKALPQDPDKFAVIVGVEKYSGGLPDALFARRDAESMREHLIALGYPARNVILLTNERASRAGLAKNLETWLPRVVNERSTVFFYYSGHGAPDPKSGRAYLVPADGDPQYLADTAYPASRLYEQLSALKAKRVIVVLDSCFSGAGGRSLLAKGTRPLVSQIQSGFAGERVVAMTASEADQISGTADDQGHGLFTYFLLKGLNGAAADASGAVTMKSLYDYLSPQVADAARRDNRDQTPQLLSADPSGQKDVKLR